MGCEKGVKLEAACHPFARVQFCLFFGRLNGWMVFSAGDQTESVIHAREVLDLKSLSCCAQVFHRV